MLSIANTTKPIAIEIFDENISSKKSGSKSSSKKRKPLVAVDSNVTNVTEQLNTNCKPGLLKTPVRKSKPIKSDLLTPKANHSTKQSPVRALNESLFEIVTESPRDVKIRELTRMVKAFKDDARCIRDIYSEEIESLRQELEIAKQTQTVAASECLEVTESGVASNTLLSSSNCSPIDKFSSHATIILSSGALASTPQRPQSISTNIDRASTVGIQHAHTIISEAESIIAMAEAMLNVSSVSSLQPSIVSVKEREKELSYWKNRAHELETARIKDQQKMNEMEIVMKGMAMKLEENAKGSLAEDWMQRVLQIFST